MRIKCTSIIAVLVCLVLDEVGLIINGDHLTELVSKTQGLTCKKKKVCYKSNIY